VALGQADTHASCGVAARRDALFQLAQHRLLVLHARARLELQVEHVGVVRI
jgi:hypothetical protein